MVQFVMIKSEKYTRTPADRHELFMRWGGAYQPIRNWIEATGDDSNIIGCYCPVSTLGCCEFSHFEETENGDVNSYFMNNGNPFNPQGVHLPLLLALRFIFEEKKRNLNIIQRIYALLTGHLKEFYKAIDKIHDTGDDLKDAVQYFGNKTLIGEK